MIWFVSRFDFLQENPHDRKTCPEKREDAAELSRWTRFAVKEGIEKCTATHDCVVERNEE
ncbi:hypothetical protein K435DRAFT_731007 [Dendrothele bispora CBS 962.96]|uniref:Uncharacterized protein n=1 Tax=Dendrothele bispora (strain CBS 962.96) TaxID=1314807 RepID=A0A4S8LDP4_DENBC|nr:hypothetical protein K435DRAFT_731007 [Dendrothele bispora CBS 962.96]